MSETAQKQPTPPVDPNHNPDQNYNPISGPTIQRDYTDIKINDKDIRDSVEEPKFSAPSMDMEESRADDSSASEQRPFNPQYNELPNKDKMEAAEKMADTIIDGYAFLTSKAGNLSKISEKKLNKEIAEGHIDSKLELPIDFNETATIFEMVQEFNQSVDIALSTDQEFKDKVRPPLTRVLAKKGFGMTDEHLLMYLFGRDMVVKTTMVLSLKSESKNILQGLRDKTQELRPIPAMPTPLAPFEPAPVSEQPKPNATTAGENKTPVPMQVVTEPKSPETTPIVPSGNKMPVFGDKAQLEHMNSQFPVSETHKPNGRPTGTRTTKKRDNNPKK